jgi:hypothetical protein
MKSKLKRPLENFFIMAYGHIIVTDIVLKKYVYVARMNL